MSDEQREVSLEEWVYKLPVKHKARKEFRELNNKIKTAEIVDYANKAMVLHFEKELAECEKRNDALVIRLEEALEVIKKLDVNKSVTD